MPHLFTDDLPEHRIPGISPPRHGIVTFSAQRFYPPTPVLQDGGTLGQSRRAPAVIDPTEVPPIINTVVAPRLPLGLSSYFPSLLDNGAASFRPSAWIRKLRSYNEVCVMRASIVNKRVIESLAGVGTNALRGLKCLWDCATRTIAPLKRCARNVIQPLVNSRLSTTRVEM